jgi:hypothetical protein
MSHIVVDQVELYGVNRDYLVEYHLASPAEGAQLNSTTLTVDGWVLGKDRAVSEIQVSHNLRRLCSTPPSIERKDVAAIYQSLPWGSTCGFAIPVSVVGLPSPFELLVSADIDAGRPIELAWIRGRHTLQLPENQSHINPVFLTNCGRSGTTWLVHLLRTHPDIIVHGSYPYESRVAAYWLHMLFVLSRPATRLATEGDFSNDLDRVWQYAEFGYSDSELADEWQQFARGIVDPLAQFGLERISQFYEEQARRQSAPDASYFVEKTPPTHISRVAQAVYPRGKELFIVRDFRDVLCSALAFDQQRGYAYFANANGSSAAEYVDLLGQGARALASAWRERKGHAHLLRYEDLMSSPDKSLSEVLGYLGLPNQASVVAEMRSQASRRAAGAAMRSHVTSGTPARSVGRWKRDLPPSLVEHCRASLTSPLTEFGYDV